MVELTESWIVENTWLSPREAEYFLLYYTEDHTIKSAAEEMGIEETSGVSHHQSVIEKVEKSRTTASLAEEVDFDDR